MELKQELETLHKAVADFRALSEKEAKEAAENHGKARTETVGELKKLNERIDGLETIVSRKAAPSDAEVKTAERSERARVFSAYARKGMDFMGPEERKVLQLADDTQAGYLAPLEFVQEIIKASLLFSPIRQYSRVMTTTMREVEIPKRTGTFTATWQVEAGAKTETTGLTYGREKISTEELYAEVHVTNQMLEDSAFNLDEELNGEFSQQFGIAEGAAFATGSGTGKPQGIITNASVSTVNSGASGDFTADGIFDLFYALKSPYQKNATFLAANSAWQKIRKLKDGQGRYIWEPSLQVSAPSTLLGRPAIEATDFAAPAAASKSLVIGDFMQGYRIVDRSQMSLLRDPYTLAANGQVKFLCRRRVGGQVVLPEAIKIQVCS